MDLDEEWVILPDDGGKQISSRKYGLGGDPNIVFHTDYFMCPSPNSQTIPKNPRGENPIFPVQVKENTGAVWETDQQTVSQVFFNNMKMDSPKSLDSMIGSKMRMERENFNERNRLESDSEEKITWGGENGGLNIWKWGLSGVGAICSFGVAAATICIVIFGNGIHQRNKQQNQPLRIYADENVRI
ncbi:Helicase [Actinidia chinensis var. chinensis]|uniref:Helicase n=1 Tax=Actinidia chinensis var. chinensis TaxID=1590841 RepID=A0A2R6S1Z3_ACTCC|nr:Helicase [Actinidia chinensis var. chinensis]